jgi:hypothetical protein
MTTAKPYEKHCRLTEVSLFEECNIRQNHFSLVVKMGHEIKVQKQTMPFGRATS